MGDATSRPWWATAVAMFCLATVLFLVYRDVFVPGPRDTEIWFGFELKGRAARLTAPAHWAIFATGAWGFWRLRSWIWPWASLYAASIAFSHLIWNLTSASGGGLFTGATQAALFSLPALALLWAKPPTR